MSEETTPTPDQAAVDTAVAEILQVTQQAGEDQPTATPAGGSEPTATATFAEPPAPTPASPFAGLVYRLGEQLFKLGPDGQPLPLAPSLDPQYLPGQFTPRAVISPDSQAMISWWDWSDLWLVELTTGQVRNLTNTPDREECCAQFWPARPEVIIFLSRSVESEGISSGNLATVNLDGSDYRLLDESATPVGLPALSPDGSTIAYDRSGKPWLYQWEAGPQAFVPADFGLDTSLENYGLTNPTWSPGGEHLTWMATGDLDGSGKPQGGVALFDLGGQTYWLVHPFEPIGTEGGLLAPVWSPDGSWLAVFESSMSQPGVWVTHLDGSGAQLVYAPGSARSTLGLQAFWSPTGQRLLVSDPNAEGGIRLTILDLSTGQVEASPLPEGALPLAWIGE